MIGALTADELDLVIANEALIGFTIAGRARRLVDHEAGYTVDDAWQDGWLGLARAARRWDPDRGAFATIAVPLVHRAIADGRDRLEGVNWRRLQRRRPGAARYRLHSIDAVIGTMRGTDDQREFADLLADPAPGPAEEAVDAVTVATMLEAARHACRDHIDLDVLDWLTDPFDNRRPGDVATAHRRTTQAVRVRRMRLTGHLAHAAEAVAA